MTAAADWSVTMKQNLSPLRPAMTAIAAVIALSSTSLLAQTTDAPADQAAPVVVAPPPPTVAAPAPQMAAPELAAPVVAPAPVMKTVGTPVVHDGDTASEAISQSAAAPTRAAPVKRISTAPSARASAPVATAKVIPAKVDTAPAPLPAPVAKSVPTATETAAATPPAAAPAPVATATQTTHATSLDDDALPIAGGAGLAVILLGGAAAYGISRRRREREEDELVLERAPVKAVAIPVAEPVVVAKAAPAPKTRGKMPKTLPNGFDISRFGRHTQAAYLGPTEDNPSFSLKRRLKRASFFDQREREAAAAGHKVEKKAAPVEAPVTQAAAAKQAAKDDGQVTIRLAPQRKRSGIGSLIRR